MSFQEDQENEIEALEAIFEEEFTITDKNPPTFKILLEPCPGEGDDENHVRVLLQGKLPGNYPDVVPELSLEVVKGLNEKKLQILNKICEDTAAENVGDVSIFTITEALKEWLADNNKKELGMHEEMMERAKKGQTKDSLAEEKEDDDDDDGGDDDGEGDSDDGGPTDWQEGELAERQEQYTNPLKIPVNALVTEESFNKWKIDFAANKKAEEEKAGIVVQAVVVDTRINGRQLFQQNLAKTLDTAKEATAKDKEEEVFWFNENIYDDDDVEDLPSDSDSEDDEDDDDEDDA